MIKPFSIIVHALRLWWRDWIGMIFLNILWFALQIPIVTGPPATAVLYTIAQRSYKDEYWEMSELCPLLRELFWPAWRWALPNGVFLGVMAVNLYAYQGAAGTGWLFLRLVWGMLLAAWSALNLFYWPFWLNQKDKSLRVTYANCGRFFLLNPLPATILAFFCVALMTVSVLLTVPLVAGAVCLLALVGITAIQNSLALQKGKNVSSQ
ncbi:MAG: hypothetical protein K8R77_01270 [Anaerolineaceae bacterium]|nr:hypothetical protein [Anaerolineaceae bacterium]